MLMHGSSKELLCKDRQVCQIGMSPAAESIPGDQRQVALYAGRVIHLYSL